MLNEKVCRRCQFEWRKEISQVLNHSSTSEEHEIFDKMWKTGTILCKEGSPTKEHFFVSVKGKPPDKCPFILEQTVSQDVE
jgi:hypothetical protein